VSSVSTAAPRAYPHARVEAPEGRRADASRAALVVPDRGATAIG